MQKSYIEGKEIFVMTPMDIILIMLAFIGVVIIAIVNLEYKRDYASELEGYFKRYKEEIINRK